MHLEKNSCLENLNAPKRLFDSISKAIFNKTVWFVDVLGTVLRCDGEDVLVAIGHQFLNSWKRTIFSQRSSASYFRFSIFKCHRGTTLVFSVSWYMGIATTTWHWMPSSIQWQSRLQMRGVKWVRKRLVEHMAPNAGMAGRLGVASGECLTWFGHTFILKVINIQRTPLKISWSGTNGFTLRCNTSHVAERSVLAKTFL